MRERSKNYEIPILLICRKRPFEKYIQDIMLDHQFPTNWGDSLFFAGCVWYYYEYLRCNFKDEWTSAIKKYRVYRPIIAEYGLIDIKKVYSTLQQCEKQVIASLKNNNLNVEKIDDKKVVRELGF